MRNCPTCNTPYPRKFFGLLKELATQMGYDRIEALATEKLDRLLEKVLEIHEKERG